MEENEAMTIAKYQVVTIKHIENVRKHIWLFKDGLTTRAWSMKN